jgi:FKBP-type peptidyl-prolyl cis-trans isomerase
MMGVAKWLVLLAAAADALRLPVAPSRRSFIAAAVTAAPAVVLAQDDATFKSVATQTGGDDFVSLDNGLKYKEVRAGTGDKAVMGDTVSIQFSGRCLNLNGKKFISTQDKSMLSSGLDVSEPFIFTLGGGTVVPGLEQAIVGMQKGGYRRVVIPQALGYDSDMKLGPTPGSFEESRSLQSIVKNPNRDASLLFDVSLERIKKR